MEELEKLLEDLRRQYMAQKAAIENSEQTQSSYILSALANRKNDIDFFGKSLRELPNDPTIKDQTLRNFKKDYERILSDLINIKIE